MATKPEFVLRLGDNALILGQRLAEWLGHGPALEEDIALANVSLDLIGQARLWLACAGRLEGQGRDEDRLAMLRAQHEFRNCTMLELPNGDYALTVVRRMLFDAYQCVLLARLAQAPEDEVAAIAAKSRKEADYHWRHSADWTVRLGDGTEESHRRAQAALDQLWDYTHELFASDEVDPDAAGLREPWLALVEPVLAQATLAIPAPSRFLSTGKRGVHSEHLGHLLAEMQILPRSHPGAQW
ncbi:MAG TPA: 1,2-phenylacetyl-CoA epoxidase subunit PaaC [Burkholderiales bacterium]|nr:1,2-phenylacetyl-CoA epoxidase subunit PaaC [Burkholderiales bacterium]